MYIYFNMDDLNGRTVLKPVLMFQRPQYSEQEEEVWPTSEQPNAEPRGREDPDPGALRH